MWRVCVRERDFYSHPHRLFVSTKFDNIILLSKSESLCLVSVWNMFTYDSYFLRFKKLPLTSDKTILWRRNRHIHLLLRTSFGIKDRVLCKPTTQIYGEGRNDLVFTSNVKWASDNGADREVKEWKRFRECGRVTGREAGGYFRTRRVEERESRW